MLKGINVTRGQLYQAHNFLFQLGVLENNQLIFKQSTLVSISHINNLQDHGNFMIR